MQSRLDKLTRDVTNTFNRLARALRAKTRKEFDRKQAVIDIERQLSGTAINDEEAKEVLETEDQMPPEQIYLIEKLFTWPTTRSLEAEWQRRNAAVKAVTLYCSVLEGGPLRGRPKRSSPTDGFDEEQPAAHKCLASDKSRQPEACLRDDLLREAEEHIRTAARPQRCFQCYGNAKLPDNRRTQEWSAYKSTVRHFRKQHLNDPRCNLCGEDFLHEMHLRNHAATMHRLLT